MTENPELKEATARMGELRKRPGQFAVPEQEDFLITGGGPDPKIHRAENVASHRGLALYGTRPPRSTAAPFSREATPSASMRNRTLRQR